jgi:hypothetical protein
LQSDQHDETRLATRGTEGAQMIRTLTSGLVALVVLASATTSDSPAAPPSQRRNDMALNSPGVPGSNLPAGEDHVMRRLADIERRMREMQAADILKPAGLQARPNGMTVFGELDVSGPMAVTGPATIGGTLGVTGPTTISNTLATTGATTIGGTLGVTGVTTLGATTGVTGALNVSGPMAVTGTLSLPAGIINNAALTNPVVPGQGFGGNTGFAMAVASTGGADLVTVNVTVPAGFTQCVVAAFGRVQAYNSTAAWDALYSKVVINGAGPSQFLTPVPNAMSTTSTAGYTTLVTGLVGGNTLVVKLHGGSGNAIWAANAGNAADLSVTYLWLR